MIPESRRLRKKTEVVEEDEEDDRTIETQEGLTDKTYEDRTVVALGFARPWEFFEWPPVL